MTSIAVESERIRAIYRQSVPVLLANVLIGAIVGATVWPTGPRALLAVWLALLVAMTGARIALRRRYWQAQPAPSRAGRWGTRFVVGSATAGVLWGIAGGLFFDPASAPAQIVVTLAIAGMCAGAAGTLSCYPRAFLAYSVPALVPLAIRTIAIGDSLHLTIAAMIVVFGLLLALVAVNTFRSITQAFQLRFENEALLDRLLATQRSLEETNRSLERRVADRTAALDRQSESLREMQRLESVGRLAAGIAHDFNNLLTVVLANVTLLLRNERTDPTSRTVMEEVQSAATRGAALVRQLLAFGRQQRLEPRVIDLNHLVADLERMLARLIAEPVRIGVTLAPTPALVRADRGQLEQVIVNLVTNARDAMPAGGRLTIETAIREADGDETLGPGAHVVLTISDTGVGIPAETRRHVFEPFFTTKPFGKGTGLGLATVYGVVEQSGGHISVDSEPGAGSIFKIYLPYTPESVRSTEPAAPATVPAPLPARPRAGRATILLAEDSAEVRAAIERVLRQAGHDLFTAASGEEALAFSRAHPGSIDLLITDVVMPDVGGAELARRLRGDRPALRVLFVSGYSPDGTLPASDAAQGIDYLPKPVTADALLNKIEALLEPGIAGSTATGESRSLAKPE
jgi:signal transduction histidine kinase/ActR/RegA family two-component response regulator